MCVQTTKTDSIEKRMYSMYERLRQRNLLLFLTCFVIILFVDRRPQQPLLQSSYTAAVVTAFLQGPLQQQFDTNTRMQRGAVFLSTTRLDISFLCHHRRRNVRGCQFSTSKDDTDDNDGKQQFLGMADAFRQLESLKSLDDPEEYIPAPEKINFDAALADSSTRQSLTAAASSLSSVSPEQDFAVYRNMVEEIETEEIAASYTEVLDELGGSTLQTDDTYSQIMTELGGTKVSTPTSSSSSLWPKKSKQDEIINVPSSSTTTTAIGSYGATENAVVSNEQLLDDALKEALNEVQLKNPELNERSILNDKDMMREIESIFDRGNAQLIESLEEIRREQQVLAETKSTDAQIGAGSVDERDTAVRLLNAERSMQTILRRVDMETTNLEKAVVDLNAANTQIEQDFLWKLKRGGIPKQAALAGFLLLSIRSILESVTAVSSVATIDSEAHLYASLIQGVVAMICAAIFFML